MNEENRYVQPQNAKEAMELIQKLSFPLCASQRAEI